MLSLATASYFEQRARWPDTGRVILAQFDAQSIVVYQAYAPSIGQFAVDHGWFGGSFRLTRMTWIKPSFLWMMHRSGWGTKVDQEMVLAVRLKRSVFDALLTTATHTSFKREVYADKGAWRQAVHEAEVQVQWDPDHGPHGEPLERRAIQLGLRGAAIEQYARDWILGIENATDFVADQREILRKDPTPLITPREELYPASADVRARLGLAPIHDEAVATE